MNKKQAWIDVHATALTRARYQRLSPIYDLMEGMAEARYHPWREKLWALVEGPRVLEVGVGTGRNIAYWPKGLQIMAVMAIRWIMISASWKFRW